MIIPPNKSDVLRQPNLNFVESNQMQPAKSINTTLSSNKEIQKRHKKLRTKTFEFLGRSIHSFDEAPQEQELLHRNSSCCKIYNVNLRTPIHKLRRYTVLQSRSFNRRNILFPKMSIKTQAIATTVHILNTVLYSVPFQCRSLIKCEMNISVIQLSTAECIQLELYPVCKFQVNRGTHTTK